MLATLSAVDIDVPPSVMLRHALTPCAGLDTPDTSMCLASVKYQDGCDKVAT
jgi:hypothetical protein